MTRTERKAYKKAQRANLMYHMVTVTRVTPKNPKNIYTKRVKFSKAIEMVYGKIDPFSGERVQNLKHKWMFAGADTPGIEIPDTEVK